jgi:hypothetical protein
MNRFLAAVALTILATPAAAEEYCVSTATGFIDAVFAARASGGASEIKMVKGTYTLPSSGQANDPVITITDQTGLTITGGYAAGCAGGVPDSHPSSTIIRPAEFDRRLMDIKFVATVESAVTIRQVSFRRGRSLSADAACLNIQTQDEALGWVALLNTEFTDCSGPGPGCALTANMYDADLNLSNSIAHTNTCNGSAVSLVVGPTALFQVVNNTIAGNTNSGAPTGAGLQVGSYTGSSNLLYLLNNVIYQNGDADDLDAQFNSNTPGFARHNIIGRRNAFPSAMVTSNNSMADPKLQTNNNFRLSANSPAINAGYGLAPLGLPTKDLDSTPRPQGGAIDVGAYESTAIISTGFRDGFE